MEDGSALFKLPKLRTEIPHGAPRRGVILGLNGAFRGHEVTAESTIPAIGTKSGRPGDCPVLLIRTTGVQTTNRLAYGCTLRQLKFSGPQ